MRRVTSALVLGCGVLALTWGSAPAAPAAAPVPVSAEELAWLDAAVPVVDALDQQMALLRARQSGRPDAERDPFTFGTQRRSRPAPPPPPAAFPDVPLEGPAQEPAVLWPTLVAVLADVGSGQLTRTAVVGWGDGVEFLKPGETFKDLLVVSISSASIDLRHKPTKTLRTIKLR